MRSWLASPIVLSLLLASCSSIPLPGAAPDEATLHTRVAQGVAATLTAVTGAEPIPAAPATETSPPPPTETPAPTDTTVPPPPATATPAPITPLSTPAPLVTVTFAPPAPLPPGYAMEEERTIGDYTIQLWRNTAGEGFGFDNLVTISSGGQILARVEFASALGEYTGRDVTGEGHPDVVIEGFTGGAHCCFSTMIYDLGPALTKVLETRPSNCAGRLEDLTGDGVYEFVTCDDVFAYTYCAYAFSPLVKVILQYESGQGYVPASPRFAALYEEDIAAHSRLAQDAASYVDSGWDGTPKCAVLPLVLDYLYSGRGEQAWDALNRFYDYPDRLLFWTEVVQTIADSSLYAASGSLPAVEVPPYYMLQLLTHCGPDSRYVGLLGQGQAGCDPGLPHRDIFWLEMQLRDIGLLNEGETLQLTPEACTTNCRLDLVRTSDSVRLGSIRLDTASGFPGAVYRVNGVESARWRLRGDLTWEKASQ